MCLSVDASLCECEQGWAEWATAQEESMEEQAVPFTVAWRQFIMGRATCPCEGVCTCEYTFSCRNCGDPLTVHGEEMPNYSQVGGVCMACESAINEGVCAAPPAHGIDLDEIPF